MFGFQLANTLPMLMISLALGYLILINAKSQGKLLKIIGYIFGVLIILCSLYLGIYSTYRTIYRTISFRRNPQKVFERLLKRSGKIPDKKTFLPPPKEDLQKGKPAK